MDLGPVREAVATHLDALASVPRAYARWQDNLDPPCLVVLRGKLVYGDTFEDGANAILVIRGLVPSNKPERNIQLLDDWCSTEGSESVPALIAANSTLWGTVSAAEVSECSGEGAVTLPPPDGRRYLSSDITVRVWQ